MEAASAASPETISLTEYYPCRTTTAADKAPADSSRGRGRGEEGGAGGGGERGQRSGQPVVVDLVAQQCSGDATDHGNILERMHTVSSTETSGYVDAASSPTAAVSSSSPAASSVVPSAPGDAMTDDAGTFYPPSAGGQLPLLRGPDCGRGRGPDGPFTCERREGEGRRQGGILSQPVNQRRDMTHGNAYVKTGRGQQGSGGGPGVHLLQDHGSAFRDERQRRNRKDDEDDDEEEEVDEEYDDEEETCSSSEEEDGDYWEREDSSMFHAHRRSSNNNYHPQRATITGAAAHRAGSTERPTGATDASLDQDQGQGQGQFLGKATQSAWLKWSHERRASFKRRVEFMEQRQTELQRIRLSSPIRKARKESVRFVAKELEEEHLSVIDPTAAVRPEDETSVYGQHPAFPFDIPPPSTKKKKKKKVPGGGGRRADSTSCSSSHGGEGVETRLSLAQWNTLVAFWEHRVFVKLRCCGLLLGLAALACGVSSLANNQWSTYENHTVYGSAHFSLWKICSCVQLNCSNIEHTKWQISVIGLVVFSTTFGSLGLALSLGGFLTSSLPKKIYYYHSAGEIDLLCCLSCVVTSVLYPMTIESERLTDGSSHELGLGYFLVCSSAGGFCLAASCLCFDDMIRSVAKLFCRRPRTQRSHGKLRVLRLCQSKS